MASIQDLKVGPAKKTIDPEIRIEARLRAFGEKELPISFSGGLFDEDGIRFASLSHWESDGRVEFPISIKRDGSNNNAKIILHFKLTQKALDHIEDIRDQDENKDINIRLRLTAGTIRSSMLSPNIHVDEKEKTFNYLYKVGRSNKSTGDINLISAQDRGEVLRVEYQDIGNRFTITSSDWVQNYCPVLGVGRFAVVDLYIPELEEAETELDKYLNDAIQTVQKMENYVQAGEWTNVIEESRKLAEVLRAKNNKLIEQWKELLGKSGYHDDALEKFYHMLENLFQFSSKFIHRTDHDHNLRDKVQVEKEDAYFIYTTSIGLVNLLSRKVQEFKKSQ